jgi:hypothetical protein
MRFIKYIFVSALIVIFNFNILSASDKNFSYDEKENDPSYNIDIDTVVKKQKMYFEIDNLSDIDWVIDDYMAEAFPIISQDAIERVIQTKTVQRIDESGNESAAAEGIYKIGFSVPVNYLEKSPKITWELNIPEYSSRIFQSFEGKEILIDVWPNVVGTISTKTYTGNFEAYRLRNYPTYKDPDPKKKDVPAVPPGVDNPLGLFVVHYDENSLRYFHGTNKNHLLQNKTRDLSHGCVRNDNENIDKMKRFIIKKMVKSADLSGWIGSKKSIIYNMKPEDKFPVKIIYKTFQVDKDDRGKYITLFKDIYNYSNPKNINTKLNESSLITLSTHENIVNEFNYKFPDDELTEEMLNAVVGFALEKPKYYEKQYIDDLLKIFSVKN